MVNLGSWMNKILVGWGVDAKIANTFDEMIIAVLLITVAVGVITYDSTFLSAVYGSYRRKVIISGILC